VEVLLLRQLLRIVERKLARPPRISSWEKLILAVLCPRLKHRNRLKDLMLFKPETVRR